MHLSKIIRYTRYSFFIFLFIFNVSHAEQLRVVSYNIKHGAGMDRVVDLDRQVAVLKELNADLIALQEVDKGCTRSGGVDQAHYIAEKLKMHYVYGKAINIGQGEYGQAILSRYPINAHKVHRLPSTGEQRIVVETEVNIPKLGNVKFCGVHYAYASAEQRIKQVHSFEAAIKDSQVPVILTGDFNSQPDSDVLKHYNSHWRVVPKIGDVLTYPAAKPKIEIDYCVWRGLPENVSAESKVIHEAMASDHRPVLTVFRW